MPEPLEDDPFELDWPWPGMAGMKEADAAPSMEPLDDAVEEAESPVDGSGC